MLGLITLPIQCERTQYQEMSVDTVKYTEQQAIETTLHKIETSIQKQIQNKGRIVNIETNTLKKGNQITVVVTLECIEKIGVRKKLEG